jgi:translation initiation factor IF-1
MTSKLPTVKGPVIEALLNTMFIVEFDQSQGKLLPDNLPEIMRCYMSGRMRKNRIQVKVGEFVEIGSSPSFGPSLSLSTIG